MSCNKPLVRQVAVPKRFYRLGLFLIALLVVLICLRFLRLEDPRGGFFMKKYYDDRHQLNMEISDPEDGFIYIKLHLPTGIREFTVTETKGNEIIELNRVEYNDNHREIRRHVSLEAYDPYGSLMQDDTDPCQAAINKEEIEQLCHKIHLLKPAQQELLIKKYWKDMKQVDIAEVEGVTKMAITKRLQTIYRYLKN